MQVPDLIRQIPDQLSRVLIYTIKKGADITERITQYWETKRTEFAQSNFWKEPFYKRNIEPLNTIDYLLLTGGLSSALLLTAIAVNLYSIAVLPLAVGVGTLLFAGACHFSFYRVRKHFDNIAYKHIDQIRKIAYSITPENQNFQDIAIARSELDQPEFSHLKEDLKKLDDEIKKFREVILSPKRKGQKNILMDTREAFKTYLEGFQRKLAPHQLIKRLDEPGESKDDGKRT